jgi:hypothetical protein
MKWNRGKIPLCLKNVFILTVLVFGQNQNSHYLEPVIAHSPQMVILSAQAFGL